MTYVHVHAPKATAKAMLACVCLDCKKRTKLLQFFTPWYGWESTCIRCGRQWFDGEWMPLNFCRGVRKQNIDMAKLYWRKMPSISENHFGIDEERVE
jgi:hypothetical protein